MRSAHTGPHYGNVQFNHPKRSLGTLGLFATAPMIPLDFVEALRARLKVRHQQVKGKLFGLPE